MILFTTNKGKDLPDDWIELSLDFRHWMIGFNWLPHDSFGFGFFAIHLPCFVFSRSWKLKK